MSAQVICYAGHLADIFFLEAPSRLELEIKVLQTSALPLGYGAISLAGLQTRAVW